MANQYNDTSVLDCFELDTVDIGGDPCHVQIVLTYDLDADCYTVERFNNCKSWSHEEFDSRDQASAFFRICVKYVQQEDTEYRSDS